MEVEDQIMHFCGQTGLMQREFPYLDTVSGLPSIEGGEDSRYTNISLHIIHNSNTSENLCGTDGCDSSRTNYCFPGKNCRMVKMVGPPLLVGSHPFITLSG